MLVSCAVLQLAENSIAYSKARVLLQPPGGLSLLKQDKVLAKNHRPYFNFLTSIKSKYIFHKIG
jgi:hypothetical protein